MIQLLTTVRTRKASPNTHISRDADAGDVRAALSLLADHIRSRQLATGGFLLWRSDKPTMENYVQVPCVFLAAVQAATHGELRSRIIKSSVERSRGFISQEKSSDGLWRFFGRGSSIEADIDDTFYCLAARRAERSVVKSVLDGLVNISNARGPLLPTWYRAGTNCVDHTVNANVLHCLGILGYHDSRVTNLTAALREIVLTGAFLEGSPYYPDPLCFLLSYLRAAAYFPDLISGSARESIVSFLGKTQSRFATQLQLSMALEAGIRINLGNEIINHNAATLLTSLEKAVACNASPWFRHRSVELYYAAPIATAMFAFSALYRYAQDSITRRSHNEERRTTPVYLRG